MWGDTADETRVVRVMATTGPAAMTTGYVHSVEVGGFVDGPGIRFVVFLSGCPLRCKYCHNPDAWKRGGKPSDASEVLERIARSADFLKAGGGGVTLSGGEPLAQAVFAHEILRGSKALGLHTALDTSGFLGERLTDEMLKDVDLVLLDVKSWDRVTYEDLTGVNLQPTLDFAYRLAAICKPVWIRFVLVPGLTDDPENVRGVARFVAGLNNVERVEVIPFHQMGERKWNDLGLKYELSRTPAPTAEQIRQAIHTFESEGLRVGVGIFAPCGPKTGG